MPNENQYGILSSVEKAIKDKLVDIVRKTSKPVVQTIDNGEIYAYRRAENGKIVWGLMAPHKTARGMDD